jgi:tetratricopeptide (TPR) repeat protein
MSAASPPGSPWIQGPLSDVLLGTGMLYLPFFAASLFVGPQLVIGSFSLVPFLILLFAFTHLGATLVRVYDHRESFRAYRLFAVWASLPIAVACLVGLWVPVVGSLMLTLYLTFVPWHFTGQNYGISLVFLRRRGLEITPELKRYLWASFFLSYLLWVLALHGAQPGTVAYAPLQVQGSQYAFFPIGIPAALMPYLLCVAGVLYVGALTEVAMRLVGRAPLRALLPCFLLILSQALWFSAPVIGRYFFEPRQLGPLAELWAPFNAGSTFLAVSLMHSLQYLWITDYYVRRESPGTTTRSFLTRSLLAGMAIFGLPFVLLLPEVAGGPSYDAGLFLMLNGALNLQHIMLDGVIWKLRNTRIASILIAGRDAVAGAAVPAGGRGRLRLALYASGAIGLTLAAAGELEKQLVLAPAIAHDDAPRIEASLERLRWLGRDNATGRNALADLKLQQRDDAGALREYERSLTLAPRARTWLKLGRLHERQGRLPQALSAYERALELAPRDVDMLVAAGRASLRSGRPERAEVLLARAVELDPDNTGIRGALEAIRNGAGAAPSL